MAPDNSRAMPGPPSNGNGANKMSLLISVGGKANTAAPHLCRLVNVRHELPMLAGFVEEILDWDIPDANMARSLAIKVLPSTTPCLVVQYRESMRSSRRYLDTNHHHRRYHSIITRLDTGVATIRPPGSLGAIIVRFKPEASALLFAEPLRHFSDTKVDLADVFDRHNVEHLEEAVAEASTSSERVAAVARFLCAQMSQREPDPVIHRAVACLRTNPSTRVHRLAADLDVSERHLLRRFRGAFGLTPKQFARGARIEKVLVQRAQGAAWADIAYRCGFSDQAHMINDFNIVVGLPPERALLPPSAEQGLTAGVPSSVPIAREYFYW